MKIYREILQDDVRIGLQDEISKACIPISASNADYLVFQYLLADNKALVLALGAPLPDGVTSTQEYPPHRSFPHV
jgi:hypothetical protein